MRTIVLLCLATALPSSCLLAADEKPKKEEAATAAASAPLPLEATKASVRRKLIEQITNLERRIQKAERYLDSPSSVTGAPDFDTALARRRDAYKEVVLTSQAQLIQALAELAKICD